MEFEKESEKLRFQPVNKGLGFHPFTDGLPYAPVSKRPQTPSTKPKPMGSGAIAAGPPKVVLPKKNALPTRPGNLATPPIPAPEKKPLPEALKFKMNPKTEEEISQLLEVQNGFEYSAKRVLAYLIDTGINLILCLFAFATTLWYFHTQIYSLFSVELSTYVFLFLFLFNWAMVTAQEIGFGTTIGKKAFGLSLEGNTSTLFMRSMFFWVSIGFFGIGIFWALFDKDRRCLHDIWSEIQPTEIAHL